MIEVNALKLSASIKGKNDENEKVKERKEGREKERNALTSK